EKVYGPRETFFLLGPSSSLCVPSTSSSEPKLSFVASSEGYCLLVAPEVARVGETELPKDAWAQPTEINCPEGEGNFLKTDHS
ncbi:hypothetical protein T265_16144, partial [Opisthorchis viverrini]